MSSSRLCSAGLRHSCSSRARSPRVVRASSPRARRWSAARAPELFAIIDELAAQAGTAPPAEIYRSALPDLGVTEVGGVLGIGSRRVLLLGAPLLEMLTVQELRAGLAHELGHYLGGETRLGGILAYAEASFRSVAGAVQRPRKESRDAWLRYGHDFAERVGLACGRWLREALLPRHAARGEKARAARRCLIGAAGRSCGHHQPPRARLVRCPALLCVPERLRDARPRELRRSLRSHPQGSACSARDSRSAVPKTRSSPRCAPPRRIRSTTIQRSASASPR